MCTTCNQNNCGGCTSEVTPICNQCTSEQATCDCPIINLSTDCILYNQDDIECNSVVVVTKNTILSDALKGILSWSCTKFDELANYLRIVNVGAGASIYAGDNLIGEKKLRKINSTSPIVTVTENTNDISLGIDSASLDTFIEANQKTYTAANIGTGANVYKDSTVVGNNTQLNLKKIKSSDSSIIITEGLDDIDITVEAGVLPDGSETKVTAGTNVTVTGVGTIAAPYVINSTSADGSETKVNAGANTTVTGTGTTATPYIINTLYSPFEKIDEGNGNGYIIRERNNTFYGNIGTDAIDFSYSNEISSINGATGINSFAIGDHVIASNYLSSSFGYRVNNDGIGSFNTGFKLIDNGYTNFLTGIGHNVTSMNVTVVGQASNIISEQILDFNSTTTKALFVVGNGTIENGTEADFNVLTRSDAFIVRMNGLATLPSVTNALITADTTGKAIVTKEYLNLQKVITYPADFIGTNYTLTNADMGYSIIIVNGATAVTITVPTGLQSKMQVGFIQDGTADITITPSGTTLMNAIGGYKINGQYDQVFLEQGITNADYYLLGNTKL